MSVLRRAAGSRPSRTTKFTTQVLLAPTVKFSTFSKSFKPRTAASGPCENVRVPRTRPGIASCPVRVSPDVSPTAVHGPNPTVPGPGCAGRRLCAVCRGGGVDLLRRAEADKSQVKGRVYTR